MVGFTSVAYTQSRWISLFSGKDLKGRVVHEKTTWSVQDRVLGGEGGLEHIPGNRTKLLLTTPLNAFQTTFLINHSALYKL